MSDEQKEVRIPLDVAEQAAYPGTHPSGLSSAQRAIVRACITAQHPPEPEVPDAEDDNEVRDSIIELLAKGVQELRERVASLEAKAGNPLYAVKSEPATDPPTTLTPAVVDLIDAARAASESLKSEHPPGEDVQIDDLIVAVDALEGEWSRFNAAGVAQRSTGCIGLAGR